MEFFCLNVGLREMEGKKSWELVTWQVDAGEVQEVIRSQASNAPSTRPVNNTDDLEALQHPPRSCQGERGVRGGRKWGEKWKEVKG